MLEAGQDDRFGEMVRVLDRLERRQKAVRVGREVRYRERLSICEETNPKPLVRSRRKRERERDSQ